MYWYERRSMLRKRHRVPILTAKVTALCLVCLFNVLLAGVGGHSLVVREMLLAGTALNTNPNFPGGESPSPAVIGSPVHFCHRNRLDFHSEVTRRERTGALLLL